MDRIAEGLWSEIFLDPAYYVELKVGSLRCIGDIGGECRSGLKNTPRFLAGALMEMVSVQIVMGITGR